MSEIELKIRKMKTDETLVACFESEADAITWLEDRDEFVEVLGTADDSISVEVSNRLRAAMRPLDDAEKAFLDEQAKRLSISYEELHSFPEIPNPPTIATRCAVFAKTSRSTWTSAGKITKASHNALFASSCAGTRARRNGCG